MTPTHTSSSDHREAWPALPYPDWKDTCTTLHLWTQIVGKIRIAQVPWLNHSWHATLYLTARGLTTSPVPCGDRSIDIEFDFTEHLLRIRTSDGGTATLPLAPRSVADFYRQVCERLAGLGIDIRIRTKPNEIPDAIPFERDEVHGAYDPDAANRFWRALAMSARVFQRFRSGFVGKCSPVHFFWGSFDLAVTRFSGRPAPTHPGGVPNLPDWIIREAYSHEVASCGFWPGGPSAPYPLYYAYAYPEPDGFRAARVRPDAARYDDGLREFVLPYDAVRGSADPEATLLAFLESTYAAAADLGGWDRAALERSGGDRTAKR